ncbi:TIGR02444 family protein [Marinobacter orientalis]|uniref:TIGR02444 family protein n=1 Tax=Marinobacter orientalis TaxID=1928859 RepID=A0A7Y0RBK1_9GAMM|nr:TIGR02444 family protein [Marinobacter orientalis]NMT63231.1 TIGR02444 family protein [Marinobacter orientalis]TGX51884.1 TIGR02444 family protein [Marinobacter orientalis]
MSCSGSKIPEDTDPENPLWHFACRLWAARRAREACLALQSRGWSVTRILSAAWLASSGHSFTGRESATVTDWRNRVTVPLRSARKYITKNNPGTAIVREYIARSELEAERVELALAYQALVAEIQTASSEGTTAGLARNNLLTAAPETKMDNETGRLLDTLARELSMLAKGDKKPC